MFKNISNISIIKITGFDWFFTSVCLLYLYFMSEYITTYVKLFFLICLILNSFKIRLNLLGKIFIIFIIVTHHGLIYGLKVTSEAAINFIVGMCGLKILEQKSFRDRHLLLFIIFLLLNASLLFQKSIFMLIYVLISYFGMILLLSHTKWNWQYLFNALKSLIIIIPFILICYTFFPRWNSQIFGDLNIAGSTAQDHKIGLSLDIDFNELKSVTPNSTLSFLSFMNYIPKPVYWRSHTLSETNGWNWKRSTSDSMFFKSLSITSENKDTNITIQVNQNIQLENNQTYFITLDHPIKIIHENNEIKIDSYSLSSLFPSRSITKSYFVTSLATHNFQSQIPSYGDLKKLIQLPDSLINKFPKIIYSSQLDLIKKVKDHFVSMGFSYNYGPGVIENLDTFLEKKVGFCSHFASYIALYLRSNKIPARLVSGYLGGLYNNDGNYYRVIENDAHVWVEAYVNSEWIRIDPTLWVSSIRAEGGNAALLTHYKGLDTYTSLELFFQKIYPRLSVFMNRVTSFTEQTNSKFQYWLENFNLSKQREIAKKWQLNLNEFYLVGTLGAIIAISIMTSWILWSFRKMNNKSWSQFKKLNDNILKVYPNFKPYWGKINQIELLLQKDNSDLAKKTVKMIERYRIKFFKN